MKMGQNVSPKLIILILISTVIAMNFATEFVPAVREGPTRAPFGCQKRTYFYEVSQSDSKGYTCSDTIEVNACWGRCDSKEISDWKFPFKKSHHPVCIPSGRTKVSTTLRNCDPEASLEARQYFYMEPVSCQCQICSSSDTSCEYPHQRGGKFTNLIKVDSEDALLSEDYSSFAGQRD